MKNGFCKLDRVKYIGDNGDMYFIPSYGTKGTVIEAKHDEYITVQWDHNVIEPRIWNCEYDKIEKIDFDCPYCAEYPKEFNFGKGVKGRIKNRTLSVLGNGINLKLPVHYCPICGIKLTKNKD